MLAIVLSGLAVGAGDAWAGATIAGTDGKLIYHEAGEYRAMDLATGASTIVPLPQRGNGPGLIRGDDPQFSPDGRYAAYTTSDALIVQQVFPTEGPKLVLARIGNTFPESNRPRLAHLPDGFTWDPTGTRIGLVDRTPGPDAEVITLDVDVIVDSNPPPPIPSKVHVANLPEDEGAGLLSWDQQLGIVMEMGGNEGVYIVGFNPDTGARSQITSTGLEFQEEAPAVGPSGRLGYRVEHRTFVNGQVQQRRDSFFIHGSGAIFNTETVPTGTPFPEAWRSVVFDPAGGQLVVQAAHQNEQTTSLDLFSVGGAFIRRLIGTAPANGSDARPIAWLTEPPSVVIGSGPSGLVAQSSASFEFTFFGGSAPPGHFECSLDSAAFAACTSPKAFSGLGQGDHAFQVRYKPDGAEASQPAERRWEVDTVPPDVAFDQAPTGTGNPSDAQIAFHSSEPDGATFRCSLDSGAGVDCSSPQSLSNLSDGPHSFSVEPFDRAGNSGAAGTVSWTVGPAAPPPVVSCGTGSSSAGFGVVTLVARATDACFVDETVDGLPAKVSRGVVSLNGIRLTPGPGTRIIVSERIGDGSVKTDGPVTVGFGDTIAVPLPSLDVNGLSTGTNFVNKQLQLSEGLLAVAGLKAIPAVQVELTPDNGGQAKVTFRVTLPKAAFKKLPGGTEVEGITAEFAPTFSNNRGVTLGGRIKVAQAFLFGRVKIKDLDLAYDHGTGQFDGAMSAVLGEARPGRAEPTLTLSASIAPTAAACGLKKLGLQASNLNKHIGDGVFLQRIGGAFECVSDGGRVSSKLIASGGVSLGPRIAIGSFEAEAISIDGSVTMTIPVGLLPVDAFSLEAKGTGKIVDVPVTEQIVKFTPPAQVEVNGTIDLTVSGYGARLEQRNNWVSEQGFNIEAGGQVNLFGLATAADGLFSSTGYAICLGPRGARTGFGERWGQPLETWSSTCDIGPFRSPVPPPAPARARAARAGASAFAIPAGRRLVVVAINGNGAPPKVILSGPRGQRVETPAGPGGLKSSRALLVQDTVQDTTFVTLYSPPAGTWRITTAPGSGVVAGVRVAQGLPPVKFTARVSGKGSKRTLKYSSGGLAGQRVQFVERGKNSVHLLATTKRAKGRLTFTPDPALGRKRRIEATVTNHGIPRLTQTIARFAVAPGRAPKRIEKIRLLKRTLAWKAQSRIKSYEIALNYPDKTTTSHTAKRARLKLPAATPRTGTIRVSIVAVDALGRRGPLTTAKLKLR